MKIGSTIQELRKKKGLKQGDFAEAIGISPTALSQIENNRSVPKKSTMEKICSVLDVPDHLIFLLSLDEDDVPEGNKEKMLLYQALYPNLRDMMLSIFYESDSKELSEKP